MHLVLHHVAEFQHVDHADSGRLIKAVAGASVVKISLAITRNSGLVGPFVEVVERRAVKDRGGEFLAELTSGPSEYSLENLSEVHSRRHTERVEHDVYGSSVLKERHVFLTHHTRHDTLVTVTSRHLVAHAYLTLLGYVDLGHLHDSGRKLIADGYVELLAAQLAVDLLGLAHIVGDQLTDHAVHALVAGPSGNVHSLIIYGTEVHIFETASLWHDIIADEILDARRLLAFEQRPHLPDHNLAEFVLLLFVFFIKHGKLRVRRVTSAFLLYRTREQICSYHDTLERGRSLEGCILHVAGLVAEDGSQKFFLRSGVALPFRSDLTDHYVARHNVGSYTDDSTLVKIPCGILADVRDVGCQFLHSALCLAHVERVFVHMHRSEDILTDHTLVEHDGVLIVVTFPGHECNLEIATEREFTFLGGISLGEYIALTYPLSLGADGTEVDGGSLIGATELRQPVFLYRRLELHEFLVRGTVVADTDHRGVHVLDHALSFGHHLSAGVPYKLTLDTGSDDRSLTAEQGDSLTHHVRSHQSAVGIVMLEEGDERRGYRGNLYGSHVHKLKFLGSDNRKVGSETGLDAVAHERTVIVDRSVALGDGVALLYLGSHVDHIVVAEVHPAAFHLAVRSLDESEIIDVGIDAQR